MSHPSPESLVPNDGLIHELLPGANRFCQETQMIRRSSPSSGMCRRPRRPLGAKSKSSTPVRWARSRTLSQTSCERGSRSLGRRLTGYSSIVACDWSRLMARHALPAIYPIREHAETGGLISYGASRAAHMGMPVYMLAGS